MCDPQGIAFICTLVIVFCALFAWGFAQIKGLQSSIDRVEMFVQTGYERLKTVVQQPQKGKPLEYFTHDQVETLLDFSVLPTSHYAGINKDSVTTILIVSSYKPAIDVDGVGIQELTVTRFEKGKEPVEEVFVRLLEPTNPPTAGFKYDNQ